MQFTLSWLEAIDSYSSKSAKQKILANLKLSSAKFKVQCKNTQSRLWSIRDNRPLLQSKRHTADENTDWLYLIRDCRLLFHKNDYSDEFIDTNYYKQNDDFELYVTKDHFYKANGTLPTKTPTDFEQYVTAA